MKQALFCAIHEEVQKLFTPTGEFRKNYTDCLKSKNKSQLEKCLKEAFEGNGATLDSGIIGKSLNSLDHVASSIQYDSPALGQWIRIRMNKGSEYDKGHPDCGISQIEAEHFEELHRIAPRHKNLLFCSDLHKSIMVKFGGSSDNNGIIHVNEDVWIKLKDFVEKGVDNPKQFILGEFIEDAEVEVKEDVKQFHALIASFKAKLNLKSPGDQMYRGCVDYFKLFLLTCLYTIMQARAGRNAIYHLIVPLRDGDTYIGSFCGAFGRQIDNEEIEALEHAFNDLIRRFYTLESLALLSVEIASLASTEGENLIRLCTWVPESHDATPSAMKRVDKCLEKLSENDKCLNSNLEEISLVSADPKFLSLMEEMCSYAKTYGTQEGTTALLYGEPGLGKGKLAELIHLFTPRSYKAEELEKLVRAAKEELPEEYKEQYWKEIQEHRCKNINGHILIDCDGAVNRKKTCLRMANSILSNATQNS